MLVLACTHKELEDPIQPSDADAIDPNRPALESAPAETDAVESTDKSLEAVTDEPQKQVATTPRRVSKARVRATGPDLPDTTPQDVEAEAAEIGHAFDGDPKYKPSQALAVPKSGSANPAENDPSATTDAVRSAKKQKSQGKSAKDILPGTRLGARMRENPHSDNNKSDTSEDGVIGSGKSKRYIKAPLLNIRSAPNRTSHIVGAVHGGDIVMVDIQGKWAKLSQGRYIRSRHLTTEPQPRSAPDASAQEPSNADDSEEQ